MSDDENEIDFSNMDGFVVLDEVGEDDTDNSDENADDSITVELSNSALNSLESGPNEQNSSDAYDHDKRDKLKTGGESNSQSHSVSLSPECYPRGYALGGGAGGNTEHPSTQEPLSTLSLSPEPGTSSGNFRCSRSPLPYRSRSPMSPFRRFSRSPLSPYRRYSRSSERRFSRSPLRRFSRSRSYRSLSSRSPGRSLLSRRFSRSPSPRSPGGTLLVRRSSRAMSPLSQGDSEFPRRFSRSPSPPPLSPGGTALINRSSRSQSPRSPGGTLLVQRSFRSVSPRSPGNPSLHERFSRSPSPRSPGGTLLVRRRSRSTVPPGDTPSLSPDRPSVHSCTSPREYRISRSPSPKRMRYSYRRSRSRSPHRTYRPRRRRSGSWNRRSRSRSRSRSRKFLKSAEAPTELMLSVQQQVEAMYDKALAQLSAGASQYQYNVPPPLIPVSVPPPALPAPIPQYLIDKLPPDARGIPAYSLTLADLNKTVLDFIKDPSGYKWVREKLKTATMEEKGEVFSRIRPEVFILATHTFASHVIQDFFESAGSANQKIELAKKLQFHTKVHSLNHYGSAVLIKALENIPKEHILDIAKGLEDNILVCSKDSYGSAVVQKCIELMEAEHLEFIVDAIKGNMFVMSTHASGCWVIQKLLEFGLPAQIAPLLDEVIITEELIKHQYGNYVVQAILEFGRPEDRSKIVSCVRGQVRALSQDKYSQRLVDKTVEKALKFQRAALIDEICGPVTPLGEQSSLMVMLQDKYAHFVVQKMMQLAEPRQMSVIIEKIKPHIKVIEALSHGRHVLASLQKYFHKQKTPLPNGAAPAAPDVNVPKTLTALVEAIECENVKVKVEKDK